PRAPTSRPPGGTYFGRRIAARSGDADLDVVPDDADFVAVVAKVRPGVVEPGALLDAELPGVPGADHAAILDVAAGERSAHVRAGVVDGGVFAVDVEDRHHHAVDGVGSSLALGDVAQLGDADEFGHDRW